MELSTNTIKNLLNVMQKVSPAIAVSIALLSNVLLTHHNIERDAEPELDQLLKIRDKIATTSPRGIIDRALIQAGGEANRSELFRVELRTPPETTTSRSIRSVGLRQRESVAFLKIILDPKTTHCQSHSDVAAGLLNGQLT